MNASAATAIIVALMVGFALGAIAFLSTEPTTVTVTFSSNTNQHTTTLVSTATVTSTSVQTIATDPCIIAGQPAGMFLRITSDSSSVPVAGAQVIAIHKQANDTCNGVLWPGQTSTTSFTTNGTTAWYSLDTTNDGSYSFVVAYSGHVYNFSAGMAPVSATCAALYVPSGRTNVTTTEIKTTCS